MNTWHARLGRVTALALVLLFSHGLVPLGAQQELRTQAEQSDFAQFTSYDNMMEYLRALQAAGPDMRLTSYGRTWSGRELPLAIFSRPMVTQPWEALASGKPIVLFQANVHGGERTQRESLLILMRDLATPGTVVNGYLDDVVLLIAPQVNPDGFEAASGATRGNAWGIDLNRDYIKLEHPEIAGLVTNVYHKWHPHLVIDGHNGGAQPYNMNYITAHHVSVSQALMDMCNNEIFQHVRKRNEDHGLKAFYYPGGNAEFWQGAPHYPRISMTYVSFLNSLGITFESPSQPRPVGTRSGVISYTAVLEFVKNDAARVMSTVQNARNETIRMGLTPGLKVAVDMRLVDHDFPVSYEIPVQGSPGQFRLIENGKLRQKPEATKLRDRPWAYVLPREARDAVALLHKHNITVEVLREPATVSVEAYRLADVRYRNEYNHQGAMVVEVDSVLTIERTFPPGTFVIPTAQVLGRLVAHMLEPESDDNVVLWNRMDAWMPLARIRSGRGAPPAGVRGAEPPAGAGGAAAAGGRGAAGGGGAGRGGAAQQQLPPLVPIFKVMRQTTLPTYVPANPLQMP